MTDGDMTIVAGIEIPSTNPVFLTVVGIHVLLGLACTITGVLAAVEGSSSDCVLAGARGHWNSPDRPRSVVASAGSSTRSTLVKGATSGRRPYFDNSRITVDNVTGAREDAVMKIDDAAAHLEA